MSQELLWVGLLAIFAGAALATAFSQTDLIVRKAKSLWNRVVGLAYLALSVGAAAYLVLSGDLQTRIFELFGIPKTQRTWNLDLLVTSSWAQTQTTPASPPPNQVLAAWLVGLVFAAILLAFVGAAFVLLFYKDTNENKRSLDAADNIVKMFGGFFIGVGSAFFGIK
jgi:hypothetical protein